LRVSIFRQFLGGAGPSGQGWQSSR
jgi:hypothetical protein